METRSLVAACCALVACSCTGGPTPAGARRPISAVLSPPEDFPSPRLIGVEAGFDPMEETKTWEPGDAVVYGIAMRSPERSQRWLVRISVRTPPATLEHAN